MRSDSQEAKGKTELTGAVSNPRTGALVTLTVAEHAVVYILVNSQRDALDDGSRDDRDQQQRKAGQEKNGKRSRWFEEHDAESL